MPGRKILRIAVLVLGSIETVLGIGVCVLFAQPTSDPLGRSIANAVLIMVAILLGLGPLPALLLAWHGRWLWPALLLAAVAPPALFLLMAFA